ncbi:lipoprotein [Spiroplasma endosymbiont of Panorpa germanica]|uniref:lipoprotein n=1 Tax=Spiroplasma endosymbiont of Panorpa germanica TaxID=3066314 RepID=UPI0030CCD67E
MKKLLSILGSLSLLTTSTISVVSCGSPEVEKLELNIANVEEFFAENKEFTYEGDFIFIDEPTTNPDWDFNPERPSKDILNSLFIETILEEMSKTINLSDAKFYDIDLSKTRESGLRGNIKSGENHSFNYEPIIVKDADGTKITELDGLKFNFKQTNTIKEKSDNEKVMERFLKYWFGGINNDKNIRFKWVKGFVETTDSFKGVAEDLEKDNIRGAEERIRKDLNNMGNPYGTFMSSHHGPIYEFYKFKVWGDKLNVEVLENENDDWVFAKVSGRMDFINTVYTTDFSAIWGFPKQKSN